MSGISRCNSKPSVIQSVDIVCDFCLGEGKHERYLHSGRESKGVFPKIDTCGLFSETGFFFSVTVAPQDKLVAALGRLVEKMIDARDV